MRAIPPALLGIWLWELYEAYRGGDGHPVPVGPGAPQLNSGWIEDPAVPRCNPDNWNYWGRHSTTGASGWAALTACPVSYAFSYGHFQLYGALGIPGGTRYSFATLSSDHPVTDTGVSYQGRRAMRYIRDVPTGQPAPSSPPYTNAPGTLPIRQLPWVREDAMTTLPGTWLQQAPLLFKPSPWWTPRRYFPIAPPAEKPETGEPTRPPPWRPGFVGPGAPVPFVDVDLPGKDLRLHDGKFPYPTFDKARRYRTGGKPWPAFQFFPAIYVAPGVWTVPWNAPGPRVRPRPGVPSPFPQPSPGTQPGFWLPELPGVRTVVLVVSPQPQPFPDPVPVPGLPRAPVTSKTKERKLRAPPGFYAAFRAFAYFLTEAQDWIDALHRALPKRYRDWRHGARGRALAVFRHFDKLDLNDAITSLFLNEAQDQLNGRLRSRVSNYTLENFGFHLRGADSRAGWTFERAVE